MSFVIDALTQLEKAMGLEATQIPEDVREVIELKEFTGREFLGYLKEEWSKAKELSKDDLVICKQYLGELVALAKMTFKVKGASNQITLPTVKDFSPTAMRAMRVFQNSMAPGASEAKASRSFKKDSEGHEVDEGVVLSRVGVDDLAKALHKLIAQQDPADVPNVEDVGKANETVPTPAAEPETAPTAVTSEPEPVVDTTKAYVPKVEDVIVDDDEPAPEEDTNDAWAGL